MVLEGGQPQSDPHLFYPEGVQLAVVLSHHLVTIKLNKLQYMMPDLPGAYESNFYCLSGHLKINKFKN